MNKEDIFNKKSAVALMTVIIVTAVVLAVGIIVVTNSIDISKISLSQSNLEMAEVNSNTCLEEGLNKLKADSTYTIASPGITITFTNGSCNYIITNGVAPKKNIILIGTYVDSNYNETKIVDTSTNPYSVTN